MKRRNLIFLSAIVFLITNILIIFLSIGNVEANNSNYIKWVDFDIPYSALSKSLNLDIKSQSKDIKLNWIDILSYLGTKYSGDWGKYKAKDMDNLVNQLNDGKTIESLTSDMKYYNYYKESYSAILIGLIGEYQIAKTPNSTQLEDNNKNLIEYESKYGLKAYSPIAYGFNYTHYDDFGNARSFGFKRKHLGNDLLGNIGTPIIAVESGVIESMGWNRYGGWRIGIRSLDSKRYYYYAHLRKDTPFQKNLKEGDIVKSGDVIGYLGMTGYSEKENVNGMTKPHLHFGMQLIFDESQKEGNNEIWINVYQIVKLLNHHRSAIIQDKENNQYNRKYNIIDPSISYEN